MPEVLTTSSHSPLLAELACDLLARGLAVRFVATGHSMDPTIRDGETIVVAPLVLEKLAIGQVCFYRSERGVLAHRVARVDRDAGGAVQWVEHRGDAGGNGDRPVRPDAILGEVVAVVRNAQEVALGPRPPELPWWSRIGARARDMVRRAKSR